MLQHREAPFLFLTGFLKSSVKVDLKWTLSWEEGLSPFLLFVFFVSFCLLGLPPHWIEKQPKMPEEKYDSIFFINPFLTSIYVFKDVKVKVIASQSRPTLYYPTD